MENTFDGDWSLINKLFFEIATKVITGLLFDSWVRSL